MSYILDALTKAAQQRDRRVPVVQRLLAPAVRMPRSPWARSLGRLVVALAVNAALLTVLLVWWLSSSPEPSVPAPEAVAPAESPRAVVESTRPLTAEPASKTTRRAEAPAPASRQAAAASPAPVVAPQGPPAGSMLFPPRRLPLPESPPAASAPLTPVTPATPAPSTSPNRAALKLEALIYSDVPSQRMVFINGRRYVVGDMVDGRLRVEEIHEDGVDLSEGGRRTTLRAAR